LLAVVLISVAVTFVHETYFMEKPWFSTTPFSLMGLALSIFLGFRNNTSYDRFWEGRKLWGGVVNTSRTITRRINTLLSDEALKSHATPLILRTIAYVHSLRMHLRNQWEPESIAEFLPADELSALDEELNRPIAILHYLGEEFRALHRNGHIDTFHLPLLEQSLEAFTNLQGGCERIKATPIPFSYNVLLHRIVGVYCLTLPFGLVSITGWITPLVTAMVAYAFLGIDAIGEEIEEPFGLDNNDLPLNTISRMIEGNLKQRLAEKLPLPEKKNNPKTHILD